jgi:hypothetical protein
MLNDVEQDKIDIILFIKIDRWFRSVKDYYKIQEILEAHGVDWKTTMESYDTSTASGRLYVNIRLSIAQDESDRTGERIKFINDNKVSKGKVISGSVPLGLRIKNKGYVMQINALFTMKKQCILPVTHSCITNFIKQSAGPLYISGRNTESIFVMLLCAACSAIPYIKANTAAILIIANPLLNQSGLIGFRKYLIRIMFA